MEGKNNKTKNVETKRRLDITKKYFPVLSAVPYGRSFFIVGSVAAGKAKPKSDIDLVVVAKKNRVWINRILVLATLSLIGKRRTRKNRENMFCVNATFCDPTDTDRVFRLHSKKKRVGPEPAASTRLKKVFELVLEFTMLGPVLDKLSRKALGRYIDKRFSAFEKDDNAVVFLEQNLIVYHPPK